MADHDIPTIDDMTPIYNAIIAYDARHRDDGDTLPRDYFLNATILSHAETHPNRDVFIVSITVDDELHEMFVYVTFAFGHIVNIVLDVDTYLATILDTTNN